MDASGGGHGKDLDRMNDALRLWYAAFSELGRQFGVQHGMHGSDAAALVHITNAEDQGAPLTQAQLARRVGLTTPATSSLLNRLERAGHVERQRDRADRRVVTLRSTPEMHDRIRAFFQDVAHDVDEVATGYSPASIALFTQLLSAMTEVLQRHLDEKTTGRRD